MGLNAKNPAKDEPIYIGNYRIEKTIGQGTYGKVKLGYQLQSQEKVAIKIIDKSSIENEKQVKRIQKEIRFLKLLHHPNIVKVYDVIETEKEIYIAMEYAAGGELFDYIVSHKRVKEKEARKFFRQIVSAMDYCHSNSVIHRDLKPENLLLDEDKNIKIIDFGFSNFFQVNSLLNTFCGSPFYAAPEMILGKRYEGPEVDIWSLGVILFALLCGHLPFDDDDVKELYRKISTAQYVTPDYLSQDSKELIGRMITVHPKKRATLEEVKNHRWLNEGLDGPPSNMIPPREPIDIENLDEDVMEKLLTLGQTKEEIIEALKPEAQMNPTKSMYYLVQEMFRREEEKIKKLRAEPRIDTTGRSTVDALAAIREDEDSEANLPPVQFDKKDKKYGKIVDEITKPAAPQIAPPPAAATPQDIRNRRASISVTPTGPPASNKAAPLFPSKKAVAPTTSATATSPTTPEVKPPQGRRLSLPLVEFKRRGSTAPEDPNVPKIRTISGWFNVSTTSSKSPEEITKEIERVLQLNELAYDTEGFLFIVDDSRKIITFELEICHVPRLAMHGLHFKRIRGNIWNYKKLCNKILTQLNL